MNLIRKIPLPMRDRNDSWFWILDDKGCFTIKSCYRLLQGNVEVPYAAFWRKLGGLKLPSKVAQFVWRVCSLCLPTTVRLATKGVQVDMCCQWCRQGQETDSHVLFECEIARATWAATSIQGIVCLKLYGKALIAAQKSNVH